MHWLSLLAIFASLSSQAFLVIAAPNPTCKPNACLSAVQSNRHHTDHSEWLPGCTSFFRRTITPPVATQTIATTIPRTITSVVTKTDVGTVRITATEHVTSTAHKVLTVATVTVTAGATIPVKKLVRDAEMQNEPRAAGKSCPTAPAGPSQLPSYASACQNTMAYSSACSCVGVTHGVTTLPRCTTSVRVTRTPVVTVTRTTHVGATTTITVGTQTLTDTVTVTDRVTATQTVCAQPTNANFLINSLDGSIVNGGITQGTILGQNLPILTQLLGSGKATKFSLDDQGHLIADGQKVGVGITGGTTLRLLPLSGILNGFSLPTCQAGPYPDCTRLKCSLASGESNFAYCSGVTEDLGKGLQLVGSLPLLGNCKYVNVTLANPV